MMREKERWIDDVGFSLLFFFFGLGDCGFFFYGNEGRFQDNAQIEMHAMS